MSHKVVPILKVAVMGMAALVVNVQAVAETRPDVLERIKPVGQVAIEGGSEPTPAAEPVAKTEAAPTPQATEPEAKAEPAPAPAPVPAQVATNVPAAATGGGDGAALYQSKVCFSCHGADSNTPIMPVYPRLAGQNAIYIEAQMKDIKSGARSHGQTAVMKGIMANVSDDEIKAIAVWISAQ